MLDRAIHEHLQALSRESALAWGLDITTAYFNLGGFRLIADDLGRIGRVRLLLGAEPTPEAVLPVRRPEDPREPEFTERQIRQGLDALDRGLHRGRDLLPFDQDTDYAVRTLLEFLYSGKVEVRRYERQFLHAKAYLFRVEGGGMLVGSSNLTHAGLRGNIELNLGHYEDEGVSKVEAWFEELWNEASPFDLGALFERLMAEYPPYLIFLRVLEQLYGSELGEEEAEKGELPLTSFQQHGVWRALRILQDCGGVLVADGVGLGKTFMAAEIIRLYRERRQKALLVCPAALRDSTWMRFQAQHEFWLEVMSYEQLAEDEQLGGSRRTLQRHIDEYALVVIDEAHNYRNPDAPARARILRRLLMGQRRDVVFLTATPVNNSLWDLYHLLRFFVKQDAHFAGRNVLSIRDLFERAMRIDPHSLNPDHLFPIIDATTVKRTRRFVKQHYQNDLIRLPDGTRVPIHFPRPVASSIAYDLDQALPGFLDQIEQALMPHHGAPSLTLARYMPENFPASQPPIPGDTAIVGLIRSGLLKRFESSVYAFAKTLEKMVREHEDFLKALATGKVVRKEFFQELSAADDEDAFEELLRETEHSEPASKYDVETLRRAVESDRDLLVALRDRARKVTAKADPKLAALVEKLAKIAQLADDEGLDDADRRRKRKVLVFSYFEDTVDWIEEFLLRVVDRDKRLAAYRGRIASVAGRDSRHGITRNEAVWRFAPESSDPPGERDDAFDLLVCTDVLAEGMNLQQARNIINYDLPWNPMRLVQRHGRVDRIGSKHDRVFLRTFFPDRQLNRLLNLEQRVRHKLAQAAASIGVEATPIEKGAEREQSFAETVEEIEKLRKNDASLYEAGGTASAAQSGEEYRQILRKELSRRREEIEGLPWKAGSGLAKTGLQRGHFFCARVGDRVYLRFVPSAVEVSGGDTAIVKETATCLRMIECTEDTSRVLPMDLQQTAYSAWERARGDIHAAWTYETDPRNLQPRVPKVNREIAEFLRRHSDSGLDEARFNRCLDAIESPCSGREQNELRSVFGKPYPNNETKAQALFDCVERLGLQPFESAKPLPPIELEEINLVCWMAIDRE